MSRPTLAGVLVLSFGFLCTGVIWGIAAFLEMREQKKLNQSYEDSLRFNDTDV